jgi:uncharacterized Rmd1/YagE family protein
MLEGNLFEGIRSIKVRALYLGERLDVRTLEHAARLSSTLPLTIQVGTQGAAVLMRYGAVVLFHVPPLDEVGLLQQLAPLVGEPEAKPEVEEVEVRVASVDGFESGTIQVVSWSVDRLQIIAENLARSVALARYEAEVRGSFAAIEPIAKNLQSRGGGRRLEQQLLRDLGGAILIQHAMAGRVEMGDKPDLLWDRPDLERLYLRLEDEYELRERDRVLERKLALISSTSESLLNLVDNRQSNRLEMYIIALIVLELLLSVWGLMRS